MLGICIHREKDLLYGESSRSFYDRSREHVQALKDKNQKYAIVKHWLESHHNLEDPPKYKFEVLGTHLTTKSRQLSEGLAIESHETEHLINGKGEYGSNRIPRFKMTLENELLGKFSNPKPQISENSVLHNPIDENPKKRNPEQMLIIF